MRNLDREIYKESNREQSLDDVVRLLVAARQKVNLDRLRQAVVDVMGDPADSLQDRQLGSVQSQLNRVAECVSTH